MNLPSQRAERGAAVVELALVLPLFLFLILAIIEASLLLLDVNVGKSGARVAARSVSAAGRGANADYLALNDARKATGSFTGSLRSVVVYRAESPGATVPRECLERARSSQNGVAGLCNIYSSEQLRNLDPIKFGYTSGSYEYPNLWDASWPPSDRFDALSDTRRPDLVGVYIEFVHQSVTGLLKPQTLPFNAVFEIEPQRAA